MKCCACENRRGKHIIVRPYGLRGQMLCDDCASEDLRACCDCGCITDDGDIAEVSFCPDCRSVESLQDLEVE